jgi:hypothetical protein
MSAKRYIFTLALVMLIICDSCKNDKAPQKITFSEQIAPIIYKNCTSCHRKGEAGPFELVTYKDVAVRASLIKFVTQTRFMPPWPADPNYTHFIDEKILSEEEIKMIGDWVDQGYPIGDSTKIPLPPVFPSGSQIGKPDSCYKTQRCL